MLLLDLSHTSHTRARTGIQRVARSLHHALQAGDQARAITWDPYQKCWRSLAPWERANLASTAPAASRGGSWPQSARWRGRWRRWTAPQPAPPAGSGLIVPELFSPAVAAALPALLATVRGPRIALFHDAIALQYPELTPAKTVGRFPLYLQELLAFDGIAAVSADSRDRLVAYWRWLGIASPPPVLALPLGLDLPPPSSTTAAAGMPRILCVGSLEGRKNHLALLDAAESLWIQGRQFTLELIGLAHPETGRAALQRVHALQAAGRPLDYRGPVDEAALERAYAACTFTVYPSLIEGFGLPVLESLARGKPCICSARGALGESARDGGCLALAEVNATSLAPALDRLLHDTAERARLTTEARQRRFRSWSDYAAELTAWMRTLPRR